VKQVWQFLTFERMASPVLLQVLFWAGVAGTLYGAYVLYQLGNQAWPFPLIFGPLLVRVIFERAIIAFRSYDRLCDIHDQLKR
jgi:hypothetical protein